MEFSSQNCCLVKLAQASPVLVNNIILKFKGAVNDYESFVNNFVQYEIKFVLYLLDVPINLYFYVQKVTKSVTFLQ